jgi:hypothetical protein
MVVWYGTAPLQERGEGKAMAWKKATPLFDSDDDFTFATTTPTSEDKYKESSLPPAPVLHSRGSLFTCCFFPASTKRLDTTNMSFMDRMKKAGKSVVDAGAKTMLRVRTRQKAIQVWLHTNNSQPTYEDFLDLRIHGYLTM